MEAALSARGAQLDIVKGGAEETILALAAAADASRVLWSRRYEGEAVALDARVKAALRERGVEATSFNGRLMREPWELSKPDGAPVGVFTAFWRRHRALGSLPAPTPAPKRLTAAPWPGEAPGAFRSRRSALDPRPTGPASSASGKSPGEAGALTALETFAAGALNAYADERDTLAPGAASRLSATRVRRDLHPPASARGETVAAADPALAGRRRGCTAALRWRDFATALLYAHSDLATASVAQRVRALPLARRREGLRAWTAGDRLSDRRRRACGSLQATGGCTIARAWSSRRSSPSDLLVDWRRGERFFMGHLVDGDLPPTTVDWQWAAGDRHRRRSPTSASSTRCCRAERFDPDGAYVRRWVPELARLQAPAVHSPWTTSGERSRKRVSRSARPIRRRSSTIAAPRPARCTAFASMRERQRLRRQLFHQGEHFLVGRLGRACDREQDQRREGERRDRRPAHEKDRQLARRGELRRRIRTAGAVASPSSSRDRRSRRAPRRGWIRSPSATRTSADRSLSSARGFEKRQQRKGDERGHDREPRRNDVAEGDRRCWPRTCRTTVIAEPS